MSENYHQKTYEVERNRVKLLLDEFVELFDAELKLEAIEDLRVDDLLLEAHVLSVRLAVLYQTTVSQQGKVEPTTILALTRGATPTKIFETTGSERHNFSSTTFCSAMLSGAGDAHALR